MSLFQVYGCCYSIAKELLKNDYFGDGLKQDGTFKAFITLVTTLLASLLMILLSLSILPFFLLRSIVWIYLKYLRGENFGGFLDGMSHMFEINDEKSAILTGFILEYDENFLEKLSEIVRRIHESNHKFSSTVQSCLGYKYFFKNQVRLEGVISTISLSDERFIKMDQLVNYFQNYKITTDARLWEVILVDQPLIDKDGDRRLAILVRINHCLADGYAMIGLFQKYFSDNKETNKNNIVSNPKPTIQHLEDLYVNNNPFSKPMDEYLFQGSKNQYLTVFLENEVNYVPKIKKIKNRLGVGFTDVLLSGLVTSVSDFLRMKFGRCSDKVNIQCTTRVRSDDMVKILNGNFGGNEINNEFSMMCFPVATAAVDESPIDTVRAMHKESMIAKSSVDAMIGYLNGKYQLTYLPTPILKKVFGICLKYSCIFSTNMLAVDRTTVANKKLINVFSYPTSHVDLGLFICVVSYDNRLQLCLSGKLQFLDDRKELQGILDSTIGYIDRLELDVENIVKS